MTTPTADEFRAGKAHYDTQVDELVARARDELAAGSEPAAVFGLITLAILDGLPSDKLATLAGVAAAAAIRIAQGAGG